jgi:hypothetical protein
MSSAGRARTQLEATRRFERRRRHVRRVVLVALPVLATASAVVLLVPPALALAPSPPLAAESGISVGTAHRQATVTVSAGWTRIGTGPFLPGERTTLVSPDGAYRVELELVTGVSAAGGSDPVPGSFAEKVGGRLDRVAWSTETLAAGTRVRYASFPDGGDVVTVAVVEPSSALPAESPGGVQLVLLAAAPADDAARYRTVTADLVSSAVFASPSRDGSPSEEAGS